MNEFLEQLRTPGTETAAIVGKLTDASAVLDGDKSISGTWAIWG